MTARTFEQRCPLGVTDPEKPAAVVKVCGCRPDDGGAAHTGAGLRKPPREKTAGMAQVFLFSSDRP
jgi:hypothetical protein